MLNHQISGIFQYYFYGSFPGHQVAGSCGVTQTPPFIDSDWVACLRATTVNGQQNQCPHGLKLDDAGYCNEDYAGSVCCLLPPKWNLNVMYSTVEYLTISSCIVFLSRNFRLIVAPRNFYVLQTNNSPRSKAS